MQATVALARAAQGAQLAPQEFTLLFGAHMDGLAVGQPGKPVLHVMPQVGGLPVQAGPPLAGSGQAGQLLPPDATPGVLVAPQAGAPGRER